MKENCKKKLFISGPITDTPFYWRQFEEARDFYETEGYAVMNPAELPVGMSNADYARICLSMIDSADEVAFLPGWHESIGARLEHDYCYYIRKPVHLYGGDANSDESDSDDKNDHGEFKMRENIGLFRGLDPGSERFKWIYGGLVLVSDPFTHDDVFNIVDETGKHTQVVPESVGECIGLKDSNGRLIFENDIVAVKSRIGEYVMHTTFEDGAFVLRSKEHPFFKASVQTITLENTECKVIGFMLNGVELYEAMY